MGCFRNDHPVRPVSVQVQVLVSYVFSMGQVIGFILFNNIRCWLLFNRLEAGEYRKWIVKKQRI